MPSIPHRLTRRFLHLIALLALVSSLAVPTAASAMILGLQDTDVVVPPVVPADAPVTIDEVETIEDHASELY